MKAFLLFACLFGAASACSADEPEGTKKLASADCTVPAVVSIRRYESLQRAAATARMLTPILDQFSKLSSKAKDNSRPIGEQLSLDDLDKFGALKQRLLTLQTKQVIESRYDKRLELLQQMALIEDNRYRWGTSPSEKDPYAAASAIVDVLKVADPINNPTTPTERYCTLQWALSAQEQASIDASGDPAIPSAMQQLTGLKNKYGFKEGIEPEKLSPDDRKVFDGLQPIIIKTRRMLDNINGVEQLKSLATTIDFMYATNMKEIDNSAGDPAALGSTARQMRNEGTLDDKAIIRIGLWMSLDDKYESDYAKAFNQMQKAMGMPSPNPNK